MYFECFREFSAIVKNLYITTCDHIEHFFDETFTLDIDNDLEQCMGMVSALCELEDISGRHTQPADSNKKAEDTKGVNLKEEITGLLKRLMKESRDKIFKFITIVQSDDYMGLTLESDLDSLLTLGQSAALRFQKMLSLAKMPDRGVYDVSNTV